MTKEKSDFLNSIIERHKHVMFLFRNGRVYLLWDHHKHLDPEDSQKILLGMANVPGRIHTRVSNRHPKDVVLYTTQKLKWK